MGICGPLYLVYKREKQLTNWGGYILSIPPRTRSRPVPNGGASQLLKGENLKITGRSSQNCQGKIKSRRWQLRCFCFFSPRFVGEMIPTKILTEFVFFCLVFKWVGFNHHHLVLICKKKQLVTSR